MTVYTDGSHRDGQGGYAVYFVETKELFTGQLNDTTANRAELTAILKAVEYADDNSQLEIYTDSRNAYHWLRGDWKIKNEAIANLVAMVHTVASLKNVTFTLTLIPRRSDQYAKLVDTEARKALQNKQQALA